MKIVKFFVALIILAKSYSQIERVEPPNWWVGMKMSEIQIMIYGKKIAELDPKIDSESIRLKAIDRVENQNYIFLTIKFQKTPYPKVLKLIFLRAKKLKYLTITQF